MSVALEVWSADYAAIEATCQRAEALGLDAFYYGESPNDLNLDCWTTLAALARSTERIRLGPVIANVLPTYRSTLLLARQAATVVAVAGDRVDLRTGVGADQPHGRAWWEPHDVTYPPYADRLADLTRALDDLHRHWPTTPVGGAGDGPTPPPITIAARGRRAMALAASRADVWETSFCTPAEFADRVATMAELGAGPTLRRSLEVDGLVATTAAGVDEVVRRFASDRGAAEDLTPVLDRALRGTPDEVADQIGELAAHGVDQLVVALHDPTDPDAIEAIAEAASLVRST